MQEHRLGHATTLPVALWQLTLLDVLAVKGACLLDEHLQCWTSQFQPCSRTCERIK